jgi:hypothetical protein
MHATVAPHAGCACGCTVLYVRRTVSYRTCVWVRRPFIHHHQNNVGRCSRFGKIVLFVGERERDSGNRGLPESDYPLAPPRPPPLCSSLTPSSFRLLSRHPPVPILSFPSPVPPPLFLPFLFCLGHDGRPLLLLLIKIKVRSYAHTPIYFRPSVCPLVRSTIRAAQHCHFFFKSSQLNGHVHICVLGPKIATNPCGPSGSALSAHMCVRKHVRERRGRIRKKDREKKKTKRGVRWQEIGHRLCDAWGESVE